MKVLILGGNGYMGPHLVKVLQGFHQLRITDIIPIESEHQTAIVDVANLAGISIDGELIFQFVNSKI